MYPFLSLTILRTMPHSKMNNAVDKKNVSVMQEFNVS